MENSPSNHSGILFQVPELDVVPLDDEPLGEVVNGHPATKPPTPSYSDSAPVSSQVIHAPRSRHVPMQKAQKRPTEVWDKISLVLTIVAVVVAFIALIIGGLGLARRGDIFVNVSSGTSSQEPTTDTFVGGSPEDRVWSFAIGDFNSRLEYIDVETGEVKGYNVDVINAVCRIANKNCQLVWDVYERCWENVPGQSARGGVGLLGGFYDACTSWAVTYDRVRTFQFTVDMSKEHMSVFMVSMSTDVSTFNWRDLTGKTIGFIQSYIQDENCLKRYPEITGANLPKSQIRYYITQQELLAAVNNGEVDAVFLNEYLEVTRHLKVASEKLSKCAVSGMAIMTRKGSTLEQWWNPAFTTLAKSPEYLQLCEGLEDENVHGSKVGPTLTQQCIGF